MSTDQVLQGERPPQWPANEPWPPKSVQRMRDVLAPQMSPHGKLFAWCDRYGRIVSVRSTSRTLDATDSPARAAAGCHIAEVPVELHEVVRTNHAVWGHGESAGWVKRTRVSFSASGAQAYSNMIDMIEILISGVPAEIERVRMERNRDEMWVDRSPDGKFLVCVRSSRPVRATFSLVDARLWATTPDVTVQFIPAPEPDGRTEEAIQESLEGLRITTELDRASDLRRMDRVMQAAKESREGKR